MLWYYADGGAQKGPVNQDDLKKLVEAGTVRPDTLVWSEGMADWKPYSEAFAPPAPPAPPAPTPDAAAPEASAPGNAVPGQAVPATSTPNYAPGGPQDAIAGAPVFVYGGFWVRFLAKLLDAVLLFFVNMMIQIPVSIIFAADLRYDGSGGEIPASFILVNLALLFVQMAIGIGYIVFFLGKYGATPGKMALSLKVVRADGSPISYGRACGRAFAEYLSSLILLIGYIIAAFDEEKRTLHDHICDTRVIRD